MLHIHYHALTQLLHTHPHWGWMAAFLIAFGESIAIIGTIVPGSITMTTIGILIGSNVLPIWTTLPWAIFGAILGDTLSYFFGRYFKNRLNYFWPFSKHPKILSKGEKFIFKHGGKSVFIGRFVGPVRAIIPLIAGMLNLSPKNYFLASIPAAIIWAPFYMLPGMLIGAASLEMPADMATGLILSVLLLLVGIWIIVKTTGYIYDKTHLYFSEKLDRKWLLWTKDPSKKWVCWLLKHADRPHRRGQILLAINSLLALILFLILFFNVTFHGPLLDWNNAVYHLFRGIRTHILDKIMVVITSIGNPHIMIILFVALFIYFLIQRKFRTALYWIGGCAAVTTLVLLLKKIYFSQRPSGILHNATTSSFPSGHTTLTVFGFGLLGYLLAYNLPKEMKKTVYWTVAFIVVAIGMSRLYLNAHWLTDVVGGTLLALGCLGITIILYQRHKPHRFSPWKMLTIAVLTIIITTTWTLSKNYSQSLRNITPTWKTHKISEQIWWNYHSAILPLYRNNRIGHPVEILNIQWAGNLTTIKNSLKKSGWESIKSGNYIMTLKKLTKYHQKIHHNLLPQLYNARPPVLKMIKIMNDKTPPLILRLWQSNIILTPDHLPLWVGTINFDMREKHLWFLHHIKMIQPQAISYHMNISKCSINWDKKIEIISHLPKKIKSKQKTARIILIKPKNL